MGWLFSIIATLGSTRAGQVFLTWLAQQIWGYVAAEVKKTLAKGEWEQNVKEVLAQYEAVIHEAQEKAKDGLTEDEKNEIRRKKIELETKLLNSGPA
jgi:hypothetical protein